MTLEELRLLSDVVENYGVILGTLGFDMSDREYIDTSHALSIVSREVSNLVEVHKGLGVDYELN